jgi:manganese/zinc/iron transport system permease protein
VSSVDAIAAVTAAACAVPGVFLVLRRMALMSDAISHVLLLGIVLAFLVTRDLRSPLLLFGAAAIGVVTVVLIETLQRTRRVKEDAAIGLVFPALFSIGIVLVSRYTSNTHLDTDAVLNGALEFAALENWRIGDVDLGPKALWFVGFALILNVVFVALFFKELKLATFDAALATALGFAPAILHYALMVLVSVTAVVSFDAVGSIVVVALMIAPAAAAYLLTDDLKWMILWSVAIAIVGSWLGCRLAEWLDASYAGSIATMLGVVFAMAFLFAPHRGLLSQATRRRRQQREFAVAMLLVHLEHHEGTPSAEIESRISSLPHHLRWTAERVAFVAGRAQRRGLVNRSGEQLVLTDSGRERARAVLNRPKR